MMQDPRFADFLFILLIGGLIWGILWLVGRSRAGRGSTRSGDPSSRDEEERPCR